MANFFNGLPKPYFIAEIGVNHNGDLSLAKQMVDAAKACGAHAVKFQSFSADTVACREALSAPHVDQALGFEGTFYELLDKLSLSHEAQRELNDYCREQGLPFLSTPFSYDDVDFLVGLNVPFLKIGSTDTTHAGFLDYAARTGKPILLSTGMCDMADVKKAVQVIRRAGNQHLALLHCISLYPPEPEEVNLRAISVMQEAFPEAVIGFSDHTIGTWASTGAIALGACIIEKHFTLDKSMPGPDQAVSADPSEMKAIIEQATLVYRGLGSFNKKPSERERSMKKPFCRSIVSKRAIAEGQTINLQDLDFKRPATGLHPNNLKRVVGLQAATDIPADTPLTEAMLQNFANLLP